MKQFLTILFVLGLVGCNRTTQTAQATQEVETTQEAAPVEVDNSPKVYICDSPWAECYHHYSNCEGLELCNRSIKEITINQAQKMGRRPCKYCAPR